METISADAAATASPLSAGELSKAEEHLTASRADLLAEVAGLSDKQWHFKASPDCWSIAENVEHLVLVEERFHGRLTQMGTAPIADPSRNNAEIEQTLLREVVNRSNKFKSPELVAPSLRWAPAETLSRFLEARSGTLKLLFEASHLRGYVQPHPILGDWDGYQWILAAACHTARHTDQIREIKESADFPRGNHDTSNSSN